MNEVRKVRVTVKTDHKGIGSHLNLSGELLESPNLRLHPRPTKLEPLVMRPRYQY